MIDAKHLTNQIIDANRAPVAGNVALAMAVRVAIEGLARCWDDCAVTVLAAERSAAKTFPPDGEPGNWESMNPYRAALESNTDPRYLDWSDVVVTDEMRDAMEGKSNPERDDHQRHVFITSTDDAELNAMQIIVQALEGLETPTQHRIIRYVSERTA